MCTSHMFLKRGLILMVDDLVEYTHTLHKCGKFEKGNVFSVIINIRFEAALISGSFTQGQPR